MGERTVHYMCKYTPVELFAGFGVPCRRLEPVSDSFDIAESLGHPNMCGYGKGLLEAVVSGNVRDLVLVNCCDVVRRIYDILKQMMARGEAKKLEFLYLIDLPHRAGDTEVQLMKRQLQKLAGQYASFSGLSFQAAAFAQAWGVSTGCAWCGDRTTEAQKQNTPSAVSKEQAPWISLQGAHSGAFLPELIRRHVPLSVRDETCTGNRQLAAPEAALFAGKEEPEKGPGREELWDAYARALLQQMPCMRMTDASARKELGSGAAGVIYHTMKFCDYYGFEYAALSGKNIRK